MRNHWRGLYAALAAFLIFHSGDGSLVGIDPGKDNTFIVRRVPPGSGIEGNTLISTSAGTVAVKESVEEVIQTIEKGRVK